MTSIGHFTLKSETPQNLSIPTFFIALAGPQRSKEETGVTVQHSRAMDGHEAREDFTVSELESMWLLRNMQFHHPRFHSKVCPKSDGYFIRHITSTDRETLDLSPLRLKGVGILQDKPSCESAAVRQDFVLKSLDMSMTRWNLTCHPYLLNEDKK